MFIGAANVLQGGVLISQCEILDNFAVFIFTIYYFGDFYVVFIFANHVRSSKTKKTYPIPAHISPGI